MRADECVRRYASYSVRAFAKINLGLYIGAKAGCSFPIGRGSGFFSYETSAAVVHLISTEETFTS